MTLEFDSSLIKAKFSEMTGRVAHTRERLVVLRHGKPLVAVIPLEDLRRLQQLDAREKRKAPEAEQHPLMKVYGAWADRDDLDDLIAEIYADREKSSRDAQIWE